MHKPISDFSVNFEMSIYDKKTKLKCDKYSITYESKLVLGACCIVHFNQHSLKSDFWTRCGVVTDCWTTREE